MKVLAEALIRVYVTFDDDERDWFDRVSAKAEELGLELVESSKNSLIFETDSNETAQTFGEWVVTQKT